MILDQKSNWFVTTLILGCANNLDFVVTLSIHFWGFDAPRAKPSTSVVEHGNRNEIQSLLTAIERVGGREEG